MRSLAWPAVVAALIGIALLIAFQHVVRVGLQQGETRRQAVAMRADAEWRCKGLRLASARVDCLWQLDSSPRDAMPPPTEHAVAIPRR